MTTNIFKRVANLENLFSNLILNFSNYKNATNKIVDLMKTDITISNKNTEDTQLVVMSQNEILQSNIDYLAIMADIEL